MCYKQPLGQIVPKTISPIILPKIKGPGVLSAKRLNAPGPLRADRRSNLFPAPLRPSLSFSCSGFAYSAEGDTF